MSVPVLVQTLIDEQKKEIVKKNEMQMRCFETLNNPQVSATRQEIYSRMFFKHEEDIQDMQIEVEQTIAAAKNRCPF